MEENGSSLSSVSDKFSVAEELVFSPSVLEGAPIFQKGP